MTVENAITIHEGSAKETLSFEDESSLGGFRYGDTFSVFDGKKDVFGKMPIKNKGKNMAAIAAKTFEILDAKKIPTHYKGYDGENTILIELADIILPDKDGIPRGTRNYVVPIEVIFRDYLHPNSSLLRKIRKAGENKANEYHYSKYGFATMPTGGEKLLKTEINYTTKFSPLGDEDLTHAEAMKLAGLWPEESSIVEDMAMRVNSAITEYAESIGLLHTDGKIELIKDVDGILKVGDVAGTPDEDRFLAEVNGGIAYAYLEKYITDLKICEDCEDELREAMAADFLNPTYIDVDKEYLRTWFEDEGWKKSAEDAKERAKSENEPEKWKEYAGPAPMIDDRVMDLLSNMYGEFARAWTTGTRYDANIAAELYVVQKLHKKGFFSEESIIRSYED